MADDGFNAPFGDLRKKLKRHRKARAKSAAAVPVAKAEPPAAPDVAPEPEPEPADAFAAATRDVAPLAARSRRVPARRKADLDSIERARLAELDAMAAADGFDLSYADGFVRGRASGVSRQTVDRLGRGEFAVTRHLDLHGYPLDDARGLVDEFLADCQRDGKRSVLLITGKGLNSPQGRGVLHEQVPQWLARGPSSRRVLAFVSARPCDGGIGALYVLLRRYSSRKNHIDVELGGVGGWID